MTLRPWITLGLALVLVLFASCTVTVDRDGDGRFLAHPIDWKKGETTALEVAETLGPPDAIVRRDAELWFTYRFTDIRTSNFVLEAYGLSLFTRSELEKIDTTLIVSFDHRDKLLYHGTSQGPLDRRLLFVDY